MAVYNVETPWDTTPDSTSVYEIYDPDDQIIIGNGIEPIFKYDNTDFTNLEGGAPKGNILVVYKDRLMVAGDPSFPHRWWYSHIRNGEGWSMNTDWIDIRPEDGGKINSGVVVNDELITSKSNGRKYGWRIYDDGTPTNSRLREIEDDKGAVNQRADILHERVNYYLDRNGVFTIPSGEPGGLSYIIKEVIDALPPTVVEEAAGGSNDGKVYIFLGDIELNLEDTISLTDVVLVYDVVNAQFYLRDNMSARAFTRFIDTDEDERLYFGDENGKVYKVDEGTLSGSTNIVMRVRTPAHFQELGSPVHVESVRIYMDEPDGTIVTYRTDATLPFRNHVGIVSQQPWHEFEVDATGKCFQMEFLHANSTVRPSINGYEITYKEES